MTAEADLQRFVFDTLRLYGVPDLVAYHAFNESKRAPRNAGFYRRLGMLPGVADIALVRPGGHAAYLELKSAKGHLSSDQRAFRDLCERNGTPYAVARTPDEAAEVLFGWKCISVNPLAKRRAA